jgi:hypothetical protein
MLYALYRRWKEANKRQDRRTARLTAAIYNTIPVKGTKKWFTEDDFMPNEGPPPKPMSVEESVNYAASLNQLFGGADMRALPSG